MLILNGIERSFIICLILSLLLCMLILNGIESFLRNSQRIRNLLLILNGIES